jgi:hypothetical protein
MPLVEVLKEVDATLYPDIIEAGSINAAISKSLADIGSHLVADESPANKFMPYVRVEEGSRFSQTQLGGGQRLFLTDFWSQGVMFGNASSADLSDIARAIHAWNAEKSSIEKMSTLFKFFSPTEDGIAHEAGIYVEHKWNSLLESWKARENPFQIRSRKQLSSFLFSLNLQQKLRFVKEYFFYLFHSNKKYSPIPVIKAAMKRPELRQLFPYTSLTRLCFSRTTGFPFTRDCPVLEPLGNGKYSVYMPNSQEVIGEGTAGEAIEMVIKHLPPNCGVAVNGTADDFAL